MNLGVRRRNKVIVFSKKVSLMARVKSHYFEEFKTGFEDSEQPGCQKPLTSVNAQSAPINASRLGSTQLFAGQLRLESTKRKSTTAHIRSTA